MKNYAHRPGWKKRLRVGRTVVSTPPPPAKPYEVWLASRGNPDFRQDPSRPLFGAPADRWRPVEDLASASILCRRFIEAYDLGGGNWTGGQVRERATRKPVARIFYNGHIGSPTQ